MAPATESCCGIRIREYLSPVAPSGQRRHADAKPARKTSPAPVVSTQSTVKRRRANFASAHSARGSPPRQASRRRAAPGTRARLPRAPVRGSACPVSAAGKSSATMIASISCSSESSPGWTSSTSTSVGTPARRAAAAHAVDAPRSSASTRSRRPEAADSARDIADLQRRIAMPQDRSIARARIDQNDAIRFVAPRTVRAALRSTPSPARLSRATRPASSSPKLADVAASAIRVARTRRSPSRPVRPAGLANCSSRCFVLMTGCVAADGDVVDAVLPQPDDVEGACRLRGMANGIRIESADRRPPQPFQARSASTPTVC